MFHILKEKCVTFITWKKEDLWAWLFKISLIVLAFFILILLIRIAPYIFSFGILFLLLFFDQLGGFLKPKNQKQNELLSTEHFFCLIRDVLCRIAKENAEILSFYPPSTVADIVPVHYSCLQTLNGVPFFRFILLPKANSEEAFTVTLALINQKIVQSLQSGSIPLSTPYYNDLPCIYAFALKEDIYHLHHIYVDLMFVQDENTYTTLKQILSTQSKETGSEPLTTLLDQDF